MSSIKEQLKADIIVAMKAREQEKLTTLRGLSAAIKQVEVDTRKDVSDDQIVQIIQKEIKKRRDANEFAEKAGRADMVEQNDKEVVLLMNYLGDQLSEDKLEEIVKELIGGGANSIGQIMGSLNKDYKGQFEGKIASQVVKRLLG